MYGSVERDWLMSTIGKELEFLVAPYVRMSGQDIRMNALNPNPISFLFRDDQLPRRVSFCKCINQRADENDDSKQQQEFVDDGECSAGQNREAANTNNPIASYSLSRFPQHHRHGN